MKALGSWQRKAILMHCVEQFKARKDELAMSLCIEAGKPIKVAARPHSLAGNGLRNCPLSGNTVSLCLTRCKVRML